MLAEQTLMNAGVLIVNEPSRGRALAGFVFNVMLIVRAPLQLFQAIQTSILPHLAGLEARESPEEFHRAIRLTIRAIAAFAGAVALGLLLIGPFVMTALLGNKGFTLRPVRARARRPRDGPAPRLRHAQPGRARARTRARLAAIAWLVAAALFVAFVALPTISAEVTRVEVGYFGGALVLCGAAEPGLPARSGEGQARLSAVGR